MTEPDAFCQLRFRRLMGGQSRGPGAALARSAAAVAAGIYRAVIAGRNAAYDGGLLRVRRLSRPVVSVGNISVGGTGKTVLVAEIARWLLDAGAAPAVLTRGYRGRTSPVGSDEAALLRRQLPGVPVEVDADRYAAGARLLAGDHPPGIFLLDDGFQHRRLRRDLDLVAIDATADPFGPLGRLLPRGLLREPVGSLARADLLVVTRANQVPPADLDRFLGRLAKTVPNLPILCCRHAPIGLLSADDRDAPPGRRDALRPLGDLDGRSYLAFCGIGNPRAFRATLDALPGRCADFRAFDDHHVYSESDLVDLVGRARAAGAELLLTTAKDLVKLIGAAPGLPIWAVDVAVRWQPGPSPVDCLRSKVLDLTRIAARPV